MLKLSGKDKSDGSHRLYTACCRCVEFDLTDREALHCVRAYESQRPFPVKYAWQEIVQRLRDAEKRCERGVSLKAPTNIILPDFRSVGQLLTDFPHLRHPVVHNLLRQGEVLNLISSPKCGKSWLATDLSLSIATGRAWLEMFPTEPGQALIIDNELHGETVANRIPKVAAARGIDLAEVANMVFVETLRGRLHDLFELASYFEALEPGRFKVIVLDAFYRFLPKDCDENDNGTVAQLYNQLDKYADRLGCCFVLIHHSSKGNQSGKSVTDVGAGAGSQSRATDTHMILRPHEEDGVVVLDAAVRSWPPLDAFCLKWDFPVWQPALDLDPMALRPERQRRRKEPREKKAAAPKEEWDSDKFTEAFVTAEAQTRAAILEAAEKRGLSQRRAETLLRRAVDTGKAYVWKFASNRPVKYATEGQPLIEGATPARKHK